MAPPLMPQVQRNHKVVKHFSLKELFNNLAEDGHTHTPRYNVM